MRGYSRALREALTRVQIVPADAIVLDADPHQAIDDVFGHSSNVVEIAAGPVEAKVCVADGRIQVLAAGAGLVEPGANAVHMSRGTARHLAVQFAKVLDVIVLEGPPPGRPATSRSTRLFERRCRC